MIEIKKDTIRKPIVREGIKLDPRFIIIEGQGYAILPDGRVNRGRPVNMHFSPVKPTRNTVMQRAADAPATLSGTAAPPDSCEGATMRRELVKDADGVAPWTSWCGSFRFPTNESACRICTILKAAATPSSSDQAISDNDILGGMSGSAAMEEAQRFRMFLAAIRNDYEQTKCKHYFDTGEKEERRCCNGRVTSYPVYQCRLTGARNPLECPNCPSREG